MIATQHIPRANTNASVRRLFSRRTQYGSRCPYQFLLAFGLILAFTACDRTEAERDEIADVNARRALDRVAQLESQVSDLEQQLRQARADTADAHQQAATAIALVATLRTDMEAAHAEAELRALSR